MPETNPIEILCWIDLETTGLSYAQDIPMEVGIILTDIRLKEIARMSWLCNVRDWDFVPQNEFVLDMHTKNGLLGELYQSEEATWNLYDQSITDWISDEAGSFADYEPVQLHPAGSSVHFDVRFCEKFFPTFSSMLHHRHYDVSSVKMFYQTLLGTYDTGPVDPHRALGDLDNDIAWIREREGEFSAILTKQILG